MTCRRLAFVAALLVLGCATPTVRLVRAVWDGDHEATAEALRADGLDLDGRAQIDTHLYQSPIEAAIHSMHADAELVRMLLDAGADPNQVGADDVPVLSIALDDHHYDVARLLLERGADPRRADPEGRSPLHHLFEKMSKCHEADAEAVGAMGEALFAKGADPNAVDAKGRHVLFLAIDCGKGELVAAMVKAGANVNVRTTEGMSPLLWAARIGAERAVPPLIAGGADLNARTKDGRDACRMALEGDNLSRHNGELAHLARAGLPCAVEAKKKRDAAVAELDVPTSRRPPATSSRPPTSAWPAPATEPAPDDRVDVPDYGRTGAYERARACPDGGTYCGNSCCGTGTICCVPDGASNRAGGMCIAYGAGRGCPWGTHQEMH